MADTNLLVNTFASLVRQSQKTKAREKLMKSCFLEGLNSPLAEYNPNELLDLRNAYLSGMAADQEIKQTSMTRIAEAKKNNIRNLSPP